MYAVHVIIIMNVCDVVVNCISLEPPNNQQRYFHCNCVLCFSHLPLPFLSLYLGKFKLSFLLRCVVLCLGGTWALLFLVKVVLGSIQVYDALILDVGFYFIFGPSPFPLLLVFITLLSISLRNKVRRLRVLLRSKICLKRLTHYAV